MPSKEGSLPCVLGSERMGVNKMAGKDFEWFVSADLNEYKRKHIAIVNQRVVASGDNAKKVWEKAKRKYPDKEPLMAKVPEDDLLIL